jgi:hypothetical protein
LKNKSFPLPINTNYVLTQVCSVFRAIPFPV